MKKLFLLLLLLPFAVFSQTTGETDSDGEAVGMYTQGWELGLLVGVASYEGDVYCFDDANIGPFSGAKVAFGIQLKRYLTENLGVRLTYRRSQLTGADGDFTIASTHPARGFEFTNDFNEIALMLDIEPFGHKSWKLSPYAYVGIGGMFGDPVTDYNESAQPAVRLPLIERDKQEVPDSKSNLVFPIGIGVKYNITERISVGIEAAIRFGANDYLDGVSISGNPEYSDYYGVGGITFVGRLVGSEPQEERQEE